MAELLQLPTPGTVLIFVHLCFDEIFLQFEYSTCPILFSRLFINWVFLLIFEHYLQLQFIGIFWENQKNWKISTNVISHNLVTFKKILEISNFYGLLEYCIVASASLFRFEAHTGLFRLLMKGIFDPYVLWPFDKKLIFYLVTRISTRRFTVNATQNIYKK